MRTMVLFSLLICSAPLSSATSTEALLLAARSLYHETGILESDYFSKERALVAGSGFKFAYVYDEETRQGYIYSIEQDSLNRTELSVWEFVSDQGFELTSKSVAPRFLVVAVKPFEDGFRLDVGVGDCFGRYGQLLWSEDEDEFVLLARGKKCCF